MGTTGRKEVDWSLYVLTDEGGGHSHLEVAEAAIAGGATVIQFRDKKMDARRLYETALRLREMTRKAGVTFIVNDRVDVALAVDADGVHVGQQDLPAAVVRRLVGPHKIVGLSATNVEEALEAEREGAADYLGVGPIFTFPTVIKPDASPPMGLEGLRAIVQRVSLPVVAIGGIEHDNVAEVVRTGVAGVAVVHAVAWAEDVADAARRMLALVREARAGQEQAS
ncbi:MAG: thiamine phosphate synthase [Anaerolineae bacterium]|nr:thiamine phosphate synthase [Anaerolineae bacterium]